MDGHGGQVSVRPAPDPLQQLLSGEPDARVPPEERQQIVFSRAWQDRAGRRPAGQHMTVLDAGFGLLHAQTREPYRNLEPDWLVQGDDEAHTVLLDPVA